MKISHSESWTESGSILINADSEAVLIMAPSHSGSISDEVTTESEGMGRDPNVGQDDKNCIFYSLYKNSTSSTPLPPSAAANDAPSLGIGPISGSSMIASSSSSALLSSSSKGMTGRNK